MEKILLVLTNLPDESSAQKLAALLVERHAAACINILPQCRSVYRWQGKIEMANEVPLLIKTTESAYARVEKLINDHHPYELPEIVAVSVESGLPSYLNWVAKEVQHFE